MGGINGIRRRQGAIMGQFDWDGQKFLGDSVALAVFRPTVVDSSLPLLVAARADDERCVVRPEHIGAFLRDHRNAVIACHDVGATHWMIAEQLERANDREGLVILWQFSRDVRFHDVGLLDQLVALARDTIARRYQPLKGLAAEHQAGTPSDLQELRARLEAIAGKPWSNVGGSLKEVILTFADAVWAVYLKLIAQNGRGNLDNLDARRILGEAT